MLFYHRLRNGAIGFLESLRINKSWKFKFSSLNQPNLIGSSLAVMLAALLGWLNNLNDEQRKSWADYLNSFQQPDGFFEDEDISDKNLSSGYTKERALFHRTRHALFALTTLDYKPKYNFMFIQDKFDLRSTEKWMHKLNLSNFWDSANKIMDLLLFLTYEAKVNSNKKAEETVNLILDICDKNINPNTGYQDSGKSELRNAMAGAMHIYPLYFLWKRTPRYPDKVIETTLFLQQSDGLFGYEVGTCGEDCLDYDATNILVNFSFIVTKYEREIKESLAKLLNAIDACKNTDGGFCCHRRNENYHFGTLTTEVSIGTSSLWSTYARLLTIAMATKVLNNHPAAGNWNLGNNIMEIWDGGTGKMSAKIKC